MASGVDRERLKQLMARRQQTHRHLADATGLSPTSVYRLEIGRGRASLHTVITVADYFGVPLDWLCNRTIERSVDDGN
jgi:transcriptional regulator with XRE-family HTH domain